MKGTGHPLQEMPRFAHERERQELPPGGRRVTQLYLDVLVAVTDVPASGTEIRDRIKQQTGRHYSLGSVSRSLGRASALGCAELTKAGWCEPFDALSEHNFAAITVRKDTNREDQYENPHMVA